jgi:N-carbamoylputrescine amidase
MKLALIQMESVVGEIEGNVEKGCGLIDQACGAGAEMIVLPEFWSTGYFPVAVNYDFYDLAARVDGHAMSRVIDKARKHGVHIVATIYEEDGPGVITILR